MPARRHLLVRNLSQELSRATNSAQCELQIKAGEKRGRLVAVATGRMLDAVDDYPAVVGSAVRGTVDIVDAGGEFSA